MEQCQCLLMIKARSPASIGPEVLGRRGSTLQLGNVAPQQRRVALMNRRPRTGQASGNENTKSGRRPSGPRGPEIATWSDGFALVVGDVERAGRAVELCSAQGRLVSVIELPVALLHRACPDD